MIEHVLAAPVMFWVAAGVLVMLIIEGLQKWDAIWAKPALAIYGTVGIWYLGDYILSIQGEYQTFPASVVEFAYGQVTGFLLLLRMFIPVFTNRIAQRAAMGGSRQQISNATLERMLKGLALSWLALFAAAVVLHDGVWLPMLWPPVEREKVGMFVHPGVGSGAAFLIAAAGYIHVLVCAMFGPIAVLGRGRVRVLAIVMIAISWPYFFFDRIRNVMLALILPAAGTYWTFGRQHVAAKFGVSAFGALLVTLWFQLVVAYRGAGTNDLTMFRRDSIGASATIGLDMMKELCWCDFLIERGDYKVNWGHRYFAEAANVVPRTLWPGKPLVGWDYAVARGFGRADGGINATIATGMIGQGVVNFGPHLGVAAAATLMAGWVAILSMLWTQQQSLGRRFLFALGLGLTFNMGRDITLLVLFPFVFGYIAIRIYEHLRPASRVAQTSMLQNRSAPRPRSRQVGP